MRPSHLLSAMLLVVAGLSPTSAADLRKIDRSLPDEPTYQSQEPKYCLLLFGQEARTRVWLVQDGNVVHVHASPDGKSAKTWRQVKGTPHQFPLGDIWEDGGKVRHRNLRYHPTSRVRKLTVEVGGKQQMAGWDRAGKLEFTVCPEEAPVVHFDGPLTLDLYRTQRPLRSGNHEEITAVVGTPGVGKGTFAVFGCDSYPPNAWPKAVIEYPAAKEGSKPVVAEIKLADD